ncbi:hypothetical protein Efla_006272 [Eimeria flavescens]
MAPPKNNARKAQQKAARRELQQKKAAAKEQKKKQKQGQIDCDEVPIDVLLQQLEEEQRQRQINRTQITLCGQPSPRAHASLTLLPNGDLLLFGGESYDGKKVRVFGDLFKWDIDKLEWRRLEAPEMPKARCSHQAVYHNDGLYVFGGEFSTYYQFHHFKDFWRFDLKTNLWNKIIVESSTQVPSARSGHRMIVWRGLLVLFGGFHDTGRETRYYNDLHTFSFSENKWRKVEFPPHAHIPEPRGGFVFVVAGDFVLLHGGFAKVRDTHKRVQGKTFTDTWLLDLKPLSKGALSQMPTWEKVKNSGTPPSPRTGAFVCPTNKRQMSSAQSRYARKPLRKRWYRLELKTGEKEKSKRRQLEQHEQPAGVFAIREERGCCDEEINEDGPSSEEDEDWQTTFAYFDSKGRLVKLRLEDITGSDGGAAAAAAPATAQQPSEAPADNGQPSLEANVSGKDGNQSDTSSTVACSPTCSGAEGVKKCIESTKTHKLEDAAADVLSNEPASPGPKASGREVQRVFSAHMPLPRLHGMLLVRGSNLILMGGIMELGSKEVTLDDCWSLNLNKRDRWICILEGTMHEQEWQGAESEAESSSESGSDDGSSRNDSDSSDSEDEADVTSDSDEGGAQRKGKGQRCCRLREDMRQLRNQYGLDDPMETPAEGETLRSFFERTKSYWIQKASTAVPRGSGTTNHKELTRLAFEAASARVSAISEALRRMDELLHRQQGQSANGFPADRENGGGSKHRK